MKTKISIIEETVQYYSEDTKRRAFNEYGTCEYLTDDGRMCAVGKCLSNPAAIEEMIYEESDGVAGVYLLNKLLNNTLDSFFKEEYQGHEDDFWSELQHVHDSDGYWNDEVGLSEEGIKEVNRLKEKYMNN